MSKSKIRDFEKDTTLIRPCGVQGCCPKVEIHHNTGKVVITNDNGDKVTLTKKQWQEVITKAKVDA